MYLAFLEAPKAWNGRLSLDMFVVITLFALTWTNNLYLLSLFISNQAVISMNANAAAGLSLIILYELAYAAFIHIENNQKLIVKLLYDSFLHRVRLFSPLHSLHDSYYF